jgi:8-oxo-dGTP diphosphatase
VEKPPRQGVTVDVVLFTILRDQPHVLLIRRKYNPFKGMWALPGGFVEEKETLEEAALRELNEETGVEKVYLEQLCTFGDPGRDPRGRTITVAYYALTRPVEIRAASDAAEAEWHPVRKLPGLAFDHPKIIKTAINRLRAKLEYSTVGFQLLPKRFTMSELQNLYETILNRKLDKRNFRKKILSLDLVRPQEGRRAAGAHRPAQLYSFQLRQMRILDGQIV